MIEYAYAFKNVNKVTSSSGGAFPSLVEVYAKEHKIENNVCVFGAAFDEEYNVKHTEIIGLNELERLCCILRSPAAAGAVTNGSPAAAAAAQFLRCSFC